MTGRWGAAITWRGRSGRLGSATTRAWPKRSAREDLGFRQTIPWVEGARRTIGWLEEQAMLESCEDHPFYDPIIAAWRATGDRLVREFDG